MKQKTHEVVADQPHSAPYLGEHRDFWWNRDFLELMAKRWGLEECENILDVGCGVGHWGRAMAPFLPKNVKINGVDREPEWIRMAQEYSKDLPWQFNYKIGLAEKIPFPDKSFDMVTCQTLLIHVQDVQKVLKEMVRVLKPGGILIIAEPNNSISELIFDTVSIEEPIEDIVKTVEFHLLCERGKQSLGLGSDSIGDQLPLFFQNMGLKDIKIFASDKTEALIPPYESEEEQLYVKQYKEWFEADLMMWDKEETKQYYLAGGGNPKEYTFFWKLLRSRFKKRVEAIANNTYSTAGGCILYLISGRK